MLNRTDNVASHYVVAVAKQRRKQIPLCKFHSYDLQISHVSAMNIFASVIGCRWLTEVLGKLWYPRLSPLLVAFIALGKQILLEGNHSQET